MSVGGRVFLVQVVKGKKVTQTVGPMVEAEARRHAQRIADAMGNKGQVFLLPVRSNEGAHPATAVHAHDSTLTRAHYPAIFGDSNDDGLPDIDDGFGPTSHEGAPIQVEETLLSAVFDRMLAVRAGYQRQVEEFLEELRAEFPGREVSGRAKTPYSLVQKLLRSFVLDPTDRSAAFKRAKAAGDPIMLKDFAGTSIYAADKHDLDRVVDYVRSKYGSSIVEFEDKYAEEDAAPMDKRKGYVAVHFVLLRDGVPIELQVKTQRMKRLGDASHTPMKNKTLDIPAYMGVVDVVRRADLGDEAAAAQIDPLLATQDGIAQLAASFTLRRNPMRAPHWTDAEYEELADWTENPHRGHVEGEWASMRHNPSAALLAAGRAALPYLRQLAASPVAQQLAADAVRAGVAAAGKAKANPRKRVAELLSVKLNELGFNFRPVSLAVAVDDKHGIRIRFEKGIASVYDLAAGKMIGEYPVENLSSIARAAAVGMMKPQYAPGSPEMLGALHRSIGTSDRPRTNIGGTGGLGQGGFFGSDTVAALRGGWQSGTLGSSGYRVGGSSSEEDYFARQEEVAKQRLREKMRLEGSRANPTVRTFEGEGDERVYGMVDVETLPYAPDRYFDGGVDVPVSDIHPIRARRKGVVNANQLMQAAYRGEGKRRGPVTLRDLGPDHETVARYELVDGNSTYANAVASGWPTIRATIEPMTTNPHRGAELDADTLHVLDQYRKHVYATQPGVMWTDVLAADWMAAGPRRSGFTGPWHVLQRLRNQHGPSILRHLDAHIDAHNAGRSHRRPSRGPQHPSAYEQDGRTYLPPGEE